MDKEIVIQIQFVPSGGFFGSNTAGALALTNKGRLFARKLPGGEWYEDTNMPKLD